MHNIYIHMNIKYIYILYYIYIYILQGFPYWVGNRERVPPPQQPKICSFTPT